MVGRPSDFSDELGLEICERIATTARGIDFICESDDALPSARTVHRWLSANPDFRQSYLRARERQADLIFDQCLEIADDDSRDLIEADDELEAQPHGGALKRSRKENPEAIQRAKLRVDTRLRMAGKLAPKKYGDKVALVGGGEGDAPIRTVRRIERVIVDPSTPDT